MTGTLRGCVALVRNVSLLMRVSIRQDHRRHPLDGDCIEGEPAKNGDDGHRHQ